jgi:hypothetical protein
VIVEVTDAQLNEQNVECRGLYARISADGTAIEVLRLFPPNQVKIALNEVVAIELVVNSVFAVINVLFVNGRCLVYAEARPSIDNNVGGRRRVIIESPAKIPRAALMPT